jgi:DNA-binding SARP family transcriptional activator
LTVSDVLVRAHLFGSARFDRDEQAIPLPPACAPLFAYLLLRHGVLVPRARLLGVVAGEVEESVARRRLNTTVWRLRRALEVDGGSSSAVLASSGQALSVTGTCHTWTDVDDFLARCSSLSHERSWDAAAACAAREAVELYQGPFLEGIDGEWVEEERSRLADLRLTVLLRLAHWHELRDEADQALRYAHLAVTDDPFREEIHQLLIRLYQRSGLPEMAVRQYEICRGLLSRELGVEPHEETRALAGPFAAEVQAQPDPAQLMQAVDDLELVREQLQRLTGVVDRALGDLRGVTRSTRSPVDV